MVPNTLVLLILGAFAADVPPEAIGERIHPLAGWEDQQRLADWLEKVAQAVRG